MIDYLADMFGHNDETAFMSHPARPCAQGDPERFFPRGYISDQQAKALCAGCPVVNKCGTYALENAVEGVWGGMTDEGRKQLREGNAA